MGKIAQLRDKAKEFEERGARVLVVEAKEGFQVRYILERARAKEGRLARPIDRHMGGAAWLRGSVEPSWPVVSDPASVAGSAYGIALQHGWGEVCSRPAAFIIDKGGVIRFAYHVLRENEERPTADDLLAALDGIAEKRALIAELAGRGGPLAGAEALLSRPLDREAEAAVPILIESLRSAEPRVRAASAAGLAWISPRAGAAVQVLRAAVVDAEPDVRRLAIEALGRIGPKASAAADDLLRAVDDRDGRVASAASAALRRLGPAAVPRLAGAIREGSERVRASALEALALFDPALEGMFPPLAAALRDEDPQVRSAAASVLSRFHCCPEASEAATLLARAARDPNARVRVAAIATLWPLIASSGGGPVAELAAALEDIDPTVAEVAAFGLLQAVLAGVDGRGALEILVAALRREDSMMRAYAAEALGRMGSASLSRLTRLLDDPDPLLRSGAAFSLREMGRGARPAAGALTARLSDADAGVRFHSACALWRIGPGAAEFSRALTAALGDRDLRVQAAAAIALTRVAPGTARAEDLAPGLVEALKLGNEDPRFPGLAASTLERMGPDAAPALSKALEDPEPSIRGEAARILGTIGPPARGAERLLRERLQDTDEGVREAARTALDRIVPAR